MRRLWRRTRPDLITIPGSELSFLFSVVGVFLWPLVSSHSVGSWLKPVLQKLDFGVGEFLQKVKENHGNGGPAQPCASTRTVLIAVVCLSERRLSQARREQENLDSDLSSMFPKVSKGQRQQTGGTCLPLVAVGGCSFLSNSGVFCLHPAAGLCCVSGHVCFRHGRVHVDGHRDLQPVRGTHTADGELRGCV